MALAESTKCVNPRKSKLGDSSLKRGEWLQKVIDEKPPLR